MFERLMLGEEADTKMNPSSQNPEESSGGVMTKTEGITTISTNQNSISPCSSSLMNTTDSLGQG
jgi:hypothetical protein